ncbi:uncharacterized protein DSM5745_07551 [Aspergillus mulundensis]|uniref:Uncharacterized protein n=1 Tax=Aspergillus mulundensis TaxID=1810919 RepID=A0A3D8REA9_9EURO|nr:hypothetical protein DSM5745_07551 [Aspergillus mulundensis]RDW72379.1 hypothetical protein DSM5745_07551 [Aspergillus mulundensis]
MKFFEKMKNVIAGRRGSDSMNYGGEYGSHAADGLGDRADYSPFHAEDYGSRFGSYETKPRPGTYGSGDYGAQTRTLGYGPGGGYGPHTNGRNHSFATNRYGSPTAVTHGSDAGVRSGRGFSGVSAAGSSYDRGSGSRDGWTYEYDTRGRKGFMPIDRVQRSEW